LKILWEFFDWVIFGETWPARVAFFFFHLAALPLLVVTLPWRRRK
jgi:hypothetical protein